MAKRPRHAALRPHNRFDLYEWCVQAPAMQARFLDAVHGGRPRTLCEDFCGPASIARAWTLSGRGRLGVGLDVDPEPLAHARQRATEQSVPAGIFLARRADVLRTREHADIIAAFNFGVCELHERADLLKYLKRVRMRLTPRGVLVADLYGGPSAFQQGTTRQRIPTPLGVVRYEWEQRRADALTGRVENAMHFMLAKGRPLRDAFVYDWRLWSVPELRDAMLDAGFRRTEVHLAYGGAIDERGKLHVRAAEPLEAPDDDDFVAYIVGRT